jgi:hypothetical protein
MIVLSVTENNNFSHNNNGIWVISEGRLSDIDLAEIVDEKIDGPYKEYKISDIGRYLLNPHSIEVHKKLIGGEIHYKLGTIKNIWKSIHNVLPAFLKKRNGNSSLSPEVIVSRYKLRIPGMQDAELETHLNKIYDQLKFYDSFSNKLALLDPNKIFQIVGICEDIGSNYSYLKLQGSIEEKIKYLGKSITKDVGVVLNKAYVGDGLYEMRGYDFKSYDAAKSYRLFSYCTDGVQKACVLTGDNKVEFYITDYLMLNFMHLLEQSLQVNPKLSKAFEMCVAGRVNPVKLFFNKKLEIDYSKSPLPAIYQDALKTYDVGTNHGNLIKPILNYLQIGISFNYMLAADEQDDRMFTHISVLHDLRALEQLRKNLPEVYTAISKHRFVTESGRYYLLDSINGYNNA